MKLSYLRASVPPWFVILFLAASEVLTAQRVPRLGTVAERLTDADLQQIAALAKVDVGSLCLLHGSWSQVLPETWLVTAYVSPEPTAGRFVAGV